MTVSDATGKRLVIFMNGSENMSDKEKDKEIVLSEQDRQLIRLIRSMKSGELHIFIADGNPTRVEEIQTDV